MDANNRRTSTPASSGGVLRQFRPSISDQWLVSNDSNSKSLHRRSSHHNSVQGVLKDSRRAPRSSRAMNQAGTSSISPNNTHAATATTMATTMIPSLSNNNNNNGTSIRLTCPECLVCVDGIQALESHLHRRHSDNASSPSVLLTCPHCSEGIKHRTNLHRHIRVSLLFSLFFLAFYIYISFWLFFCLFCSIQTY